jgi:hypothetical protein
VIPFSPFQSDLLLTCLIASPFISFHLRDHLQCFAIQEHLIPFTVALLTFLGILVQIAELSQMLAGVIEI